MNPESIRQTRFIPMMESRLMKVQGQLIRVTAFPQVAFGHLCIDMHMSVVLSRREGSSLYFIPPDIEINAGLFELKFSGIERLRDDHPAIQEILSAWRILSDPSSYTEKQIEKTAAKYQTTPETGRLEISFDRFSADMAWPYYRRKIMHEYTGAHFSEERSTELTAESERIGIDPEAPLVCFHARSTEWYGYLGRAIEEKTNNRHRCMRMDSLCSAMDWLADEGWQVVRIGDPYSAPFFRKGVLDLATHPDRTGALELYLMLNSDFIVCGESGVTEAVTLLGRPSLNVGALDVSISYPLRKESQLFPRTVIDARSGCPVTLAERFQPEFTEYPLDMERFRPQPCDPNEVLAAVQGMVDEVSKGVLERPDQIGLRNLIARYAWEAREHPVYLKWGLDGRFMGEGRIAGVWIDRHGAEIAHQWERSVA